MNTSNMEGAMKYLSHYVQEAQTALFNELGIFFAFGQEIWKCPDPAAELARLVAAMG